MFNCSEQLKKEATHTDDVGYLYRVFGNEPKAFCVDYWDSRFNCWSQDLSTSFLHLIKIIK